MECVIQNDLLLYKLRGDDDYEAAAIRGWGYLLSIGFHSEQTLSSQQCLGFSCLSILDVFSISRGKVVNVRECLHPHVHMSTHTHSHTLTDIILRICLRKLKRIYMPVCAPHRHHKPHTCRNAHRQTNTHTNTNKHTGLTVYKRKKKR